MIGIVLDVMANAIAPHIGPSKALQHGDDGFALLIGDGVEGLAGLIHSLNLLNDRMAGGEGIQRHGLFLAVDLVEFDMPRSEEHTSELQSLMRISYAVFCLKKKKKKPRPKH